MKNPLVPTKLLRFRRKFGNRSFKLLDIGAGNHSASLVKHYLPNASYFGVDIRKDYNNDASDFELMDGFWEKDLTKLQFDDIPDGAFDAILMAHIIEHLENGDEVIQALLPKLKREGLIYIEYPGKRSMGLPSKKGTLNFHDDDTHVRLYSILELKKVLEGNGCEVLESGTRKDWRYIALMPFKIPFHLLKSGYVPGSVYWDYYGFAEFIFAKRN
jgi:2-polyprenyl-3-methyl-5-hydroxy-6-metoxy-1,4-benzoquinol methylase